MLALALGAVTKLSALMSRVLSLLNDTIAGQRLPKEALLFRIDKDIRFVRGPGSPGCVVRGSHRISLDVLSRSDLLDRPN